MHNILKNKSKDSFSLSLTSFNLCNFLSYLPIIAKTTTRVSTNNF